jgi:hypothetical protein
LANLAKSGVGGSEPAGKPFGEFGEKRRGDLNLPEANLANLAKSGGGDLNLPGAIWRIWRKAAWEVI